MANIEAGNDRELIIRDLVESYDLSITSSSRPGGICAVSTLINIYEKYGFHTLDRVLRLCVATWEGAPMSFSSNMFNAKTSSSPVILSLLVSHNRLEKLV